MVSFHDFDSLLHQPADTAYLVPYSRSAEAVAQQLQSLLVKRRQVPGHLARWACMCVGSAGGTTTEMLHMPTKSFIVGWWSRIFYGLRVISPHFWLSKCIRKANPTWRESYGFTDLWVLGNFLASALLFELGCIASLDWIEWVAVRYGGLMVVEAFVYEINLLVFGGHRAAKSNMSGGMRAPRRPLKLRVLSFRRLMVMSLQNYVAIIFWFALFYRHWSSSFKPSMSVPVDSFATWLNLSFSTMTTFGYATVSPNDTWAILLTLAQSGIGVFMALLILASFISLLPPPMTMDKSER